MEIFWQLLREITIRDSKNSQKDPGGPETVKKLLTIMISKISGDNYNVTFFNRGFKV